MSDKLKSASKLPELRVILFIVFGVGVWFLLVAGMVPVDQPAMAKDTPAQTLIQKEVAAAQR